ncbi:MAG: hypothetical protein AB1757_05230 [Acidobacteriota bacterium]
MAVLQIVISTFAEVLRVRALSFAFTRIPERRNKQHGFRYDDCFVHCESIGEAGDVVDQLFVSPDSIPVLSHTHLA